MSMKQKAKKRTAHDLRFIPSMRNTSTVRAQTSDSSTAWAKGRRQRCLNFLQLVLPLSVVTTVVSLRVYERLLKCRYRTMSRPEGDEFWKVVLEEQQSTELPAQPDPLLFHEDVQEVALATYQRRRSRKDGSENDSNGNGRRSAICHGTVDNDHLAEYLHLWASYHVTLGFDEIFFRYSPGVASGDAKYMQSWEDLLKLPYITAIPRALDGNDISSDAVWCYTDAAKSYDLVLFANFGEFLYLREGQNLQSFLRQYPGYNYFSFGKYLYTTRHAIAPSEQHPFGLAAFPFTTKSFCFAVNARKHKRGVPWCPLWKGRSKVMVNPKMYPDTGTYGSLRNPDPAQGQIHFSTDIAHMKEWVGLAGYDSTATVIREPSNFVVSVDAVDVQIPNFQVGFPDIPSEGQRTLFYDADLADWFNFVLSQGTPEID